MATATVYVGPTDFTDLDFRDFTAAGDGDVSDNSTSLLVSPGEFVSFRWEAAVVGILCVSSIQYDIQSDITF